MGSFVGGIYAKEPTALLTRIIARRLAVHMSSTWEQLRDLTLPVVSYFSGFRMNCALEPLFRGAKIEDCWLPVLLHDPGSHIVRAHRAQKRNPVAVRARLHGARRVPPPRVAIAFPERDRDRDRDGVGGKRARSDSKKTRNINPGGYTSWWTAGT